MTSLPLADVVGAAGVVAALVAVDGWWANRHLHHQDKQLEEIHLLVNSRLSDVTRQLAEATERIVQLEAALHTVTGIPHETALPAVIPNTPEKAP